MPLSGPFLFEELDAAAGVTLRPERKSDLPFLRALFTGVRTAQFAAIPGWGAEQVESLLAQQFALQHRQYHQMAQCRFDIVERAGVPVGRLCVQLRETQLHLVDIALMPDVRSTGIGTALLRSLLATAARHGLGVGLVVEHGNPARRLYERLGFVTRADYGVDLEMAWSAAGEARSLPALPRS